MGSIGGTGARTIAVDVLALGTIAGLLAAIHVLVPYSAQVELVHSYDRGNPLTAIVSAYTHIDRSHLIGNIVGFGAVTVVTYLLCLKLRARLWFWLTTVTFLVLLPFFITVTSGVILESIITGRVPPSQGFSGIVAGYGGFLFVALLAFLARLYDDTMAGYVGQIVIIALLGELLVIYAPRPTLPGVLVVAIGVGLGLVGIVRRSYRLKQQGLDRDWRHALLTALLSLSVLGVLGILVYGLFPANLVQDGTFTNVIAHAAGFFYGAILSAWGYRYWAPEPLTDGIGSSG